MPNPGSDEPLTKVTLNLYTEDVKKLRERLHNWTAWVRDLVHAKLREESDE